MSNENPILPWVEKFDLESLETIKEVTLTLREREFVPVVVTMSDEKSYTVKVSTISKACMVDISVEPAVNFYYFADMKSVRKFSLK